jgi:hypothetical protein
MLESIALMQPDLPAPVVPGHEDVRHLGQVGGIALPLTSLPSQTVSGLEPSGASP